MLCQCPLVLLIQEVLRPRRKESTRQLNLQIQQPCNVRSERDHLHFQWSTSQLAVSCGQVGKTLLKEMKGGEKSEILVVLDIGESTTGDRQGIMVEERGETVEEKGKMAEDRNHGGRATSVTACGLQVKP